MTGASVVHPSSLGGHRPPSQEDGNDDDSSSFQSRSSWALIINDLSDQDPTSATRITSLSRDKPIETGECSFDDILGKPERYHEDLSENFAMHRRRSTIGCFSSSFDAAEDHHPPCPEYTLPSTKAEILIKRDNNQQKADPPISGMGVLSQYVEQRRDDEATTNDDDDDGGSAEDDDNLLRLPSPPSMTMNHHDSTNFIKNKSERQNKDQQQIIDDVKEERTPPVTNERDTRGDDITADVHRYDGSADPQQDRDPDVSISSSQTPESDLLDHRYDDYEGDDEEEVVEVEWRRPNSKGNNVHFPNTLVSRCEVRPRTNVEDIPDLYFLEQEIYQWEQDRRRTSTEHVEVELVSLSRDEESYNNNDVVVRDFASPATLRLGLSASLSDSL